MDRKNTHPNQAVSKLTGWLRRNLFSNLVSGAITLATVPLCLWLLATLFKWALWHAVWQAPSLAACHEIITATHGAGAHGACWAVFVAHADFLVFGFYPPEHLWRPILALILLPVALAPLFRARTPRVLVAFSLAYPILAYALIWGAFGLEPVDPSRFGGVLLSLIAALAASAFAIFFGIAMALGRQYLILPIRCLLVALIEVLRGIPTLNIVFAGVFFAAYALLPGWLPPLLWISVFLISLPATARIAEAVWRELIAIPEGQRQAALALGLSENNAFWRVSMAQAIHRAAPQIALVTAGVFRDTTLLYVLGLLIPLGAAEVIRVDQAWNGAYLEIFAATGLLYWSFCFAITRYARVLARKQATEYQYPINCEPEPRRPIIFDTTS